MHEERCSWDQSLQVELLLQRQQKTWDSSNNCSHEWWKACSWDIDISCQSLQKWLNSLEVNSARYTAIDRCTIQDYHYSLSQWSLAWLECTLCTYEELNHHWSRKCLWECMMCISKWMCFLSFWSQFASDASHLHKHLSSDERIWNSSSSLI